jgi:hypothetical protein
VIPILSLQQARADFARWFRWDYWATLTYAVPLPEFAAAAHIRAWCQSAATDVFESHICLILVSDLQERGAMHHHCLIALVDKNARRLPMRKAAIELRDAWLDGDSRAGFTRFTKYDPARGAPWYLARHRGDWSIPEFCSRAPLCRRQRCRKVAWLHADVSR